MWHDIRLNFQINTLLRAVFLKNEVCLVIQLYL